MKKTEAKPMTVMLPRGLHALFKAKAAAHGLALQEAVRRALLAFLRGPKEQWL